MSGSTLFEYQSTINEGMNPAVLQMTERWGCISKMLQGAALYPEHVTHAQTHTHTLISLSLLCHTIDFLLHDF